MPSRGRASISQTCVSGNLEVEMKMQSLAASSSWCSERCATVPEVASYTKRRRAGPFWVRISHASDFGLQVSLLVNQVAALE